MEQFNEQAQPVAEHNVLQVFVRDGCLHCAEAKEYLTTLASERPRLRIVLRPVDRDARARDDLMRYSQNAGIWPPVKFANLGSDLRNRLTLWNKIEKLGHRKPLEAPFLQRFERSS